MPLSTAIALWFSPAARVLFSFPATFLSRWADDRDDLADDWDGRSPCSLHKRAAVENRAQDHKQHMAHGLGNNYLHGVFKRLAEYRSIACLSSTQDGRNAPCTMYYGTIYLPCTPMIELMAYSYTILVLLLIAIYQQSRIQISVKVMSRKHEDILANDLGI